MIYQLSQQRTVTISGKKHTQVFSYCWKGAAVLLDNLTLLLAANQWSDQLDTFNPPGSTTSDWIYSQVMQLPDNSVSLNVNSPHCDIILTAVDLNNVNAPCTVKISTNTTNFQQDVNRAITRLMIIIPPRVRRVLITNAVIRVKEG